MDDRQIILRLDKKEGEEAYTLSAKFEGNEELDASITFWHGPDDKQIKMMDYLVTNMVDILNALITQHEMKQ